MYEWIISSQETRSKLLTFLTIQLEGRYSARYLKRAIENNCCMINGRTERFATTLLGNADKVVLLLDETPPFQPSFQIDPSKIIYEDKDIFIYNKPSGIACDENGILKILQSYDPALHLVHRLDRDTTGVLILVKNQESYLNFLNQFKQLQIEKCYRAIADGIIGTKEGITDNYLGKKKVYSGQAIWGAIKTGGMRAITAWKTIKCEHQATLLYCFPKTGRTHQIRVHLTEMGHPILGDFQYGKSFKCKYRPAHYLLHAEKIGFLHPKTGKMMIFEAKLSEDFLSAQKQLFGIL